MTRVLPATCLLLLLAVPAAAQDAFEKAFEVYRELIDRPPLARRLMAMQALARAGDVRAVNADAPRYSTVERTS